MKTFCHICESGQLRLLPEFSELKRVTSDCKPWSKKAPLGICGQCATVQSVINDDWRGQCQQIYEAYTIYHQASGAEQFVFDAAGNPAARSDQLLEHLKATHQLPASGTLLDIGCGNGSFLRSFNQAYPDWQLFGSEYNETHRQEVESIPGVRGFFPGNVFNLSQTFDAVSLIHVLEHLESPRKFVQNIQRILKPGGLLVIELPSYSNNPFELLIADHASHFDRRTIRTLVESAGFRIDILQDQWVPKELSILAVNEPPVIRSEPTNNPERSLSQTADWLRAVVIEARSLMNRSSQFGLFGTSIAATWLLEELDFQASFLVDEDPNRVGRFHCGLPIRHPLDVAPGSDVYVGLSAEISAKVTRRLNRPGVKYHHVSGV